jgi:hypothetical protein
MSWTQRGLDRHRLLERLRRRARLHRRTLLAVGLVLVAIALLDVLIDGPLRRIIENRMNERLKGYSVSLRAVDFSPWALSIDLLGLTVVQDAQPEPPVAEMPAVRFNVQWSSLFRGRLVGDARLERPRLFVDLAQLQEESRDDVDIRKRGWQAAILAAYPLKINHLEIDDGALTYRHRDPQHPLELSDFRLRASNIRNVRSPEHTYPSSFELESRLFGSGRVRVSGRTFSPSPSPESWRISGSTRCPWRTWDPWDATSAW